MGTCFRKPINSAAEIVPHNHIQPTTTATTTTTTTTTTTVRLYGGSPRSTAYIRFALKYKAAAAVSLESEPGGDQFPVIEVGSERVSGPSETLLQFIDSRFPHPPVFGKRSGDEEPQLTLVVVKELAELQHKSITWHLERLVRWTADLSARQRKGRAGRRGDVRDPKMGSARMEVKKLGKSYSQLLEVMMEHAQMEERLLFPIFNVADPGICKAANEEHARDLPIMNGIKEDLKSIEVLAIGSPVYQEALANFCKRLKSLQERCRQHFSEEEKQVLPYTEAAELSEKEQQRILDQCLDVMEDSHSRLFNFLLEGLLPHDAMHYLDLISMCSNKERTTTMIQMTIS